MTVLSLSLTLKQFGCGFYPLSKKFIFQGKQLETERAEDQIEANDSATPRTAQRQLFELDSEEELASDLPDVQDSEPTEESIPSMIII